MENERDQNKCVWIAQPENGRMEQCLVTKMYLNKVIICPENCRHYNQIKAEVTK